MNKINFTQSLQSITRLVMLQLFCAPVMALTVTGGSMTLNIDREQLANSFTHNHNPARVAFYLEEYFDSSQAASRSPSELLNGHIIPGSEEISALNRQLSITPSVSSNQHKATTFSFARNDLAGSASGVIGLGGALRYRLNIPSQINPFTGEETGNRAMTGYFSLEYDAAKVDASNAHSGWSLFNHFSFRAVVFDLSNVTLLLSDDSLSLDGELLLGQGFEHMGGNVGSLVGHFSLHTTVVPVPAAFWLFVSGLSGLLLQRKYKG